MSSFAQTFIRLGKATVSGLKDAFSSSSVMDVPYKLLLIGETGSGKTSFLNLLCNYTLVKKMGFESGFKNFKNFSDIEMENALNKKMESKTSGVTLYSISLNDLDIGIIDTPGFGDSRGMEVDKKHVEIIMEALRDIDHVNCVCLVINGRQARMTASLRYVLAEITSILPKSILDNVIVVFTNAANALELTFDIDSLKEYFGKDVEKCYTIENPYCLFEKAKEKKGKIPEHMIAKSLKEGFQKAGKELNDMHKGIKELEAVHTNHFTQLFEKKKEIERKVLDMLSAYDTQVKLAKDMKKKQEEVEAARNTKNLNKDFQTYTTVTRWKSVNTSYHNTLCGASGCYKTCHEHCNLPKSFDKEIFQNCGGVYGTICRCCGHSYRLHFHDEVKMVEVTETEPLIDDEMKKRFEEADSSDKMAELAQNKIRKQINDSEKIKKELSHKLLLILEEFHQLGLNKNYAKLLECHLFTVRQRKETSDNQADIANLTKTEEQIEKKLVLVKTTLEEPWSPKADPAVQKKWACKMLGINPDSTFSKADVEKEYKALIRVNHPDKQGDDDTAKKLNRAREILI